MRFERTELLYGSETLKRLSKAHVLVAGLGAVGSYAVEGLARSGVGRLRLVDFDVVRESNINRQLYAMDSTVGKRKAELAAARVRDINPACDVVGIPEFIDDESIARLLGDRPDVVVDAIDSVGPKLGLIKAVHSSGVPVLSSMGAAMRTDPSMIKIGDISETEFCPLARQIRKRLKRNGINGGVRCVYSTEPIPDNAMIKDGEEWTEEDVMPRGRPRRTMGSSSCITGIFGLTVANEAVRMLMRT
ncbi:hypothetical protein BVX97_01435 [bacterium E08(2017)]|nr:hypothetical protein BVX97_01435 [bacterium E08(2017)]